jgi:hypothetical protein
MTREIVSKRSKEDKTKTKMLEARLSRREITWLSSFSPMTLKEAKKSKSSPYCPTVVS